MIIHDVETARGGPFRVRPRGSDVVLTCADPRDLPWEVVAMSLTDHRYFFENVLVMDGGTLEARKRLMDAWRRHYGLPEFDSIRRLVYLIETYHDDLEFDLQAHLGLNLGKMWRQRKWRRLLTMIDRLPSWSRFAQAVAEDEKHIDMLVKALEGTDQSDQKVRPKTPVLGYTPQVEALHMVVNELRLFRTDFYGANRGKNSPPPRRPELIPPPETAHHKAARLAREKGRKEKFSWLAQTFLPGRVPAELEAKT